MTYSISEAAANDLREIFEYISQDNPVAAQTVFRAIRSKIEIFATQPRMGRIRTDIASDLRYLPVGNYLIFYRIAGQEVQVARVIHGARDVMAIEI